MSDSKHRMHVRSPLTPDFGVHVIPKEPPCLQVNLPGVLASGGALITRLDWASEPQVPREGFKERSVLEGLRGIFHKLFIEMHNMQT